MTRTAWSPGMLTLAKRSGAGTASLMSIRRELNSIRSAASYCSMAGAGCSYGGLRSRALPLHIGATHLMLAFEVKHWLRKLEFGSKLDGQRCRSVSAAPKTQRLIRLLDLSLNREQVFAVQLGDSLLVYALIMLALIPGPKKGPAGQRVPSIRRTLTGKSVSPT
jgi:hypothetical protein